MEKTTTRMTVQMRNEMIERIRTCSVCQWGARDSTLCEDCNTLMGPPVPMFGAVNSEIVFVGEAPGETEVEKGKPFVGRAGAVLHEAYRRLGLDTRLVYFTNALKCRPVRVASKGDEKPLVKNRTPTEEEILTCPYLREEMDLLRPKIVVAFGRTALRGVCLSHRCISSEYPKPDISDKMPNLHGTIWENAMVWDDGHQAALAVMYHPAAIIYRREWRASWKKDWENLIGWMKKNDVHLKYPERK